MLDYGAPFGFLFQDREWFRKFALASLLTYTVIGVAPVFGWTIEVIRRVAQGEEPLLPELKGWKLFWKLGGKFALVNAVWLLPLLFAVILLYLPLIFANRLQDEVMLAVFAGNLCCVMVFLFLYTIVYVFFFPSMMISLSRGEPARKAMNPFHLWKIVRPQFMGHLIVFLIIGMGLLNVIALLSALTLFLLLPPMLVYAGLVAAHYAGQLGKETQPAALKGSAPS
jgi:Protein of unknown function (DUF4013)